MIDTESSGVDGGLIAYGVICLLIVLVFTYFLIRHYQRPSTPWVVLMVTYIGWFMVFSICFLVPIDLLPASYGSDLKSVWTIYYWTTQALSWILCPLLSGYYENGGFNFRQRMILSLRYNLILFSAASVAFLAGIVYLRAAAGLSWTDISGLLACMSNVVGLSILIVLAGYGLVEVPRSLWHSSDAARRLDLLYYNAAAIYHEKDDTCDELASTFTLIRQLESKVNSSGSQELREAFQVIQDRAKSVEYEMASMSRRVHPFELKLADQLKSADRLTMSHLIKLNFHVYQLIHHLNAVQSQWSDSVREAKQLNEDILYTEAGEVSQQALLGVGAAVQSSWWRRWGKRVFYRSSAVFCAILSALILFCEITILSSQDVSPLGQLIKAVHSSPTATQIFSVVPLIYLSACSYYPLFRMRLSKLYYVSPHQTSEDSMLTNVTFLLRVSASLAYNYVLLLRIDATSLQSLIGKINVIPFFGGSFTEIFPIFIAVFAVFFLFDIPSYVFACLNIQRFKYLSAKKITYTSSTGRKKMINVLDQSEYDEDVADQMNEGMNLINSEQRKSRGDQMEKLESKAAIQDRLRAVKDKRNKQRDNEFRIAERENLI